MFNKITGFLKESRDELKKVTWPDREEVTSYTMVVIMAVIIVSLFLWGVDSLLATLITVVMN